MKYIALLRGVSPASAPNATLVTLFGRLGFVSMQTIGSSGNILFVSEETDVEKLEQMIESALRELLGPNALAIVRTSAQINSLVEAAPFNGRTHTPSTYLAVTFLKHALADTIDDPHMICYEPNANAICTVNDNTAKPHFMARIEREYGKENTTRTWNVVLKIAHKLSES